MAYALYYATAPAPSKVDKEALQRLVAVHFTTEQDAFHAAALVLRGGQYVWLIEGPDLRASAKQVVVLPIRVVRRGEEYWAELSA